MLELKPGQRLKEDHDGREIIMPDLLSCPFCGKDAQIAPDEIGSGGQHVPPYHAGCLRGAGCGIAFTADDPGEAIAEWNRRALSTVTPAEVGGLVERLRCLTEAQIGSELDYIRQSDQLLNEAATALSERDATIARLSKELADAKAEVARYWTSADIKPWCDLAEEKGLGHFGKKLKGMFSRAMAAEEEARRECERAERAESSLAEREAEMGKMAAAIRRYYDVTKEYFSDTTYDANGLLAEADAEIYVMLYDATGGQE